MPEASIEVLLVEDDPAHTELVLRAFAAVPNPFSVAAVASIREARAYLAERRPPALIIADWRLSDGDGTALITDQPQGVHVPVVVMTSHGSERIAVEAMRSGALDYVVKSESVLHDMPHIAERAIRSWQHQQDRHRAEAELRRRVRELTALSAVATAGADAADEVTLLRRVVEVLGDDLLFPEGVAIFLLDTRTRTLRPIPGAYRAPDMAPDFTVPLGRGITGQVAASGVLRRVADTRLDPDYLSNVVEMRSELCVPLRVAQRVVGVIDLEAEKPGVFTDADEQLLVTVASQLSTAIERLRANKSVRMSEARFRQLSDASLEGIILCRTGLIVDANTRLCRMSGYPLAELIGRSVLDLLPQESRAAAKRFLAETTPGLHESVGLRKDGQRLPIEVEASHVEVEGKDTLILAVRDISERKRLEDELRQSQKLQVLGQLAGGIAHDFNNLLTVILGYSDLVLSVLPADEHTLAADVQQIRDAGTRAAAMTQQLLAFGRRQVLDLKRLNLNDVIRPVHHMLERLIGEHIALTTDLDPDCDPIVADRGQLEQVLMNLVANARDAMAHGGSLTISTRNVRIPGADGTPHDGLLPGPYVLLSVTDTGSGMAQETAGHIFEPFYTTKAPGRGTGLGLATVHGIVAQLGGQIHVETAIDMGTTFRIYLPVAAQPGESADSAPEIVSSVPVADESILLVEDEPAVRRLAYDILSLQGYSVIEATAEQAIVLAADYAGPIDLLIADVVMPSMSGPELGQRLLLLRPELRVLYISGYGDEIVAGQGSAGAYSNFLQKPFTPASLGEKVRSVLDGH